MNKYPLLIRITVLLIFLIALVYCLIMGRNFLYPIFLAILFAYLLYPVARRLEKLKFPRILANLLSIILAFLVILGGIYLLYQQIAVFASDFPSFKQKALSNVNRIEGVFLDVFNIQRDRPPGFFKTKIVEFLETSGFFLEKALSATAGTLAKMVLLPVYVFFLLYYRDKFHNFLLKITPAEKHTRLERIVGDVSSVTKRYMGGIVMVVSILCVLNSVGLLIVGIQYPIMFGVISALMNFIPYFGTLIGGAIPLIFALLTEESLRYPVGVVILFLIIQFIENNILTPNIVGGQLNINPFFIILIIIIGGILWGMPGMIVSVPFLGMFKIMCDNSESLKAYSFLLSTQGTEKHSITFKKVKGIFKRKKDK